MWSGRRVPGERASPARPDGPHSSSLLDPMHARDRQAVKKWSRRPAGGARAGGRPFRYHLIPRPVSRACIHIHVVILPSPRTRLPAPARKLAAASRRRSTGLLHLRDRPRTHSPNVFRHCSAAHLNDCELAELHAWRCRASCTTRRKPAAPAVTPTILAAVAAPLAPPFISGKKSWGRPLRPPYVHGAWHA